MPPLKLRVLVGLFSIHRFPADSEIPRKILASSFFTISKTDDELSVVCDSKIRLSSQQSVDQWSCLKVLGPLDFSLTGILAGISTTLATSGISILAISTFDTDFVLVNSEELERTTKALSAAGYIIVE